MKSVTIRRLFTGSHGTFGRITLDGKSWWSLERPLTGDHPAIPVGQYFLSLGTHHAGQPDAYPCYWVGDVPGRSAIQIHKANAASQLQGCIAPGLAVGFPTINYQPTLGLMSSGDAFQAFMRLMSGQPGDLIVTEEF